MPFSFYKKDLKIEDYRNIFMAVVTTFRAPFSATTASTPERQAEYERRGEEAVEVASRSILEIRGDGDKEIGALFLYILRDMGERRHAIATLHGHSKAHLFGLRRDSERCESLYILTPLDDQYLPYGNRLMAKFRREVGEISHDFTHFYETSRRIESVTMGRRSVFSWEIFSGQKVTELEWNTMITSGPIRQGEPINKETSFETIREWKEKNPKMYQRDKMHVQLRMLNVSYPSIGTPLSPGMPRREGYRAPSEIYRKSEYLLGTSRFEVNGKLYALSQYLTWMYRTYDEDPVARMEKYSRIHVIHQDPFLLRDMLNEIAILFTACLRWTAADGIDSLKDRVALWGYLFSHSMPFARGSAAIRDWLETALYRSLGYDCTYHKDYARDWDALTSLSFEESLESYRRRITLTDRPAPVEG